MNRLLYFPIAIVIAMIQSLPLVAVSLLGRFVGHIVWWVDWKHRRIALVNLDIAFGTEKSATERTAIARESFRRLGEAFFCALKTAVMRQEEINSRLRVVGLNKIQPWIDDRSVPGIVFAIGHFGNIEMYGEAARQLRWVEPLILYRETGWKIVDRILSDVRKASTTSFFNEHTQASKMRETIRKGNVVLGLMSDYDAGKMGMSVPFFKTLASTSTAPVVHAHRFGMPLFVAVCFRSGSGKWRVEISDQIETRTSGKPRPAEEILMDLNDYLEIAICRDPANWCWMQSRWEHGGQQPKRKDRQTGE